jgi:deoxycytidine triphosphate deaminase
LSVLGRSKLEQRFRDGVFVAGTWSEENLRGAGYDLRIACDYLVLPNGKRYWGNGPEGHQKRDKPFVLKPGQVAFGTTVEELQMPDDLAGNIAVKFRKALDGILVMGGFLVDPGYTGRLHFQLANIGREPFCVVPAETSIAALQLLSVDGDSGVVDHPAPQTEQLLGDMFNSAVKDERLGPLAFFSLRRRVKKLDRRLSEGINEIEIMKRSSRELILFGIIVIFAAILAGAVAAIISA